MMLEIIEEKALKVAITALKHQFWVKILQFQRAIATTLEMMVAYFERMLFRLTKDS